MSDNLIAVNPDLSFVRNEQTEDVLQKDGFPRTGWSENGGNPPLGYIEGDVLEHRVGSEGFGHPLEGNDWFPWGNPWLRLGLLGVHV